MFHYSKNSTTAEVRENMLRLFVLVMDSYRIKYISTYGKNLTNT